MVMDIPCSEQSANMCYCHLSGLSTNVCAKQSGIRCTFAVQLMASLMQRIWKSTLGAHLEFLH